jgi:hypothetical protein
MPEGYHTTADVDGQVDALEGHGVDAVVARGWAGITNGELVRFLATHRAYDLG